MKILLRIAAVPLVALGLFLDAAVVNALFSSGGARAGVAIAYVVGSIILFFLAVRLWRAGETRAATPAGTPPPPAA